LHAVGIATSHEGIDLGGTLQLLTDEPKASVWRWISIRLPIRVSRLNARSRRDEVDHCASAVARAGVREISVRS
jgi:hypothetical protein